MPRSPLPPREGISAAVLRAPGGKATSAKAHLPVPETIGRWLREEFPTATDVELRGLFGADSHLQEPHAAADTSCAAPGNRRGELCEESGRRVAWGDAVVPGGFYFFHRPIPPEERIPFEVSIVHEDAELLVVDKPHFLASTPNGRFVRECVVTRLRVDLDQPDLVAIHRLDRITAGLLILSKRPQTRGRYQRLFQDRKVHKTYRALAAQPPDALDFPRRVSSRMEKPRGGRQVIEVAGEPNAHSRIDFLGAVPAPASVPQTIPDGPVPDVLDSAPASQIGSGVAIARASAIASGSAGNRVGEYLLEPLTGKTHQLRVHMNSLGLPILGDPVYPVDLEPDPYDFDSPLQLLASTIEFMDPLSGKPRRFETGLRLGRRT